MDANISKRLGGGIANFGPHVRTPHNPDPQGIVIIEDEHEIRTAEAEIAARLQSEDTPPSGAVPDSSTKTWIYLTRDVVHFHPATLAPTTT